MFVYVHVVLESDIKLLFVVVWDCFIDFVLNTASRFLFIFGHFFAVEIFLF